MLSPVSRRGPTTRGPLTIEKRRQEIFGILSVSPRLSVCPVCLTARGVLFEYGGWRNFEGLLGDALSLSISLCLSILEAKLRQLLPSCATPAYLHRTL